MHNESSLKTAGLAFVPTPPGFNTKHRSTLDAYLSVIAGLRFMWTLHGGIVVYQKDADKAALAMYSGSVFAAEADERLACLQAEAETQCRLLNPRKGQVIPNR